MKIISDTNVLISATFWDGDSHKIISKVESKEVELILSEENVKEYEEVLEYKEIQDKIKDKQLEMKLTAQKIRSLAKIVTPSKKISAVKDDPDDDRILETAIEGKVDYIVSRDKHLLKLKEYENIKIVSQKEFLDILNQK